MFIINIKSECFNTREKSWTQRFCLYERSRSDVLEAIRLAKLQQSDLKPLTQLLHVSNVNPDSDNLRLLQVDERLLGELQNGQVITFKGSRNDSATLCSSSATYEIKEAETSNSMLVVPNLTWPAETSNDGDENDRKLFNRTILKTFYTYLEARLCKPKLSKLIDMLKPTTYCGPELEYAVDRDSLVTLRDLQCSVQASDVELLRGLEEIKAIEIDGFYRVLAFNFEFRVLSQMLDLIDENSWPLDRIRMGQTVESLKNIVPQVILENLFKFYTTETELIDEEQFYKYDECKVCTIFAQYILKDVGKFNLNDFLEVWKNSVPEGMLANVEALRGVALFDTESNPPVVWAFNETKLPENLSERLKVLFQTKEKWTVDEISPYIKIYTTDKLDANAFLTKHARGSYQNGVRYYSAKHSK